MLRLIRVYFYYTLISDNFQDQMKRELAYREEMVQQLQMVRLLMVVLNTDGNMLLNDKLNTLFWIHKLKENQPDCL